jgi:hypothetical protein
VFVDRFYTKGAFILQLADQNNLESLGVLPKNPDSPFSAIGPSIFTLRINSKSWDDLLDELGKIGDSRALNAFWKTLHYKWPSDKRTFDLRKAYAKETLTAYKDAKVLHDKLQQLAPKDRERKVRKLKKSAITTLMVATKQSCQGKCATLHDR